MDTIFDIPQPGIFQATHLAEVVSVEDPDQLSRVQIRLLNFDGLSEHDAPIWARVATAFAGQNYGAFFIPNVGDEVLVTFLNGDPRLPIVIGSLWNGNTAVPETIDGSEVDRWTLVGKAGTRIAIEEISGGSTISFETVGGVSGKLTDDGSQIELSAAGSTITMDGSAVKIETAGNVEVKAAMVKVEAGMVKVDSGMADFSGVVKCSTLIATSVIGTSYTPGAGNIW